MAEDLKISQMPSVTNPTGAEMIPVAIPGSGGSANSNGSIGVQQVVDMSQDGMVSEETWNAERKQFNLYGYINATNSQYSDSSEYRRTGLLPLNKVLPIKVVGFGTKIVAAVTFLDANVNIIKNIPYEDTHAIETIIVNTTDFPPDAAFFSCSTWVNKLSESSYTNSTNNERNENATAYAIQKSKHALFDDMWIAAGHEAGFHYTSIDKISDPTHPYVCNEVHLTYDEAQEVMVVSTPDINMYRRDSINAKTIIYRCNGYSQNHRTNVLSSKGGFITSCHNILALRVSTDYNEMVCNAGDILFWNCRALVNVYGVINISAVNAVIYTILPALVNVKFKGLKANFGLPDSPLLSLDSLSYLVTNAANGTTAITVTVHPTVYAKLTDTSNTEWHAVLTAAVAKNISFATNA